MGAGLVGASHSSSQRPSQVALDAVWVGTVLFSFSIMGLVTLATLEVGAGWRAVLGVVSAFSLNLNAHMDQTSPALASRLVLV